MGMNSGDNVRVESGTVTWDLSSVIPWNDPSETYGVHANPTLAEELRFKFIVGDRGELYGVKVSIDPFISGRGYWSFRVHIYKNIQPWVSHSSVLRIPIPNYHSNVINSTERYIKDTIRKSIMGEAVQPIDFYK